MKLMGYKKLKQDDIVPISIARQLPSEIYEEVIEEENENIGITQNEYNSLKDGVRTPLIIPRRTNKELDDEVRNNTLLSKFAEEFKEEKELIKCQETLRSKWRKQQEEVVAMIDMDGLRERDLENQLEDEAIIPLRILKSKNLPEGEQYSAIPFTAISKSKLVHPATHITRQYKRGLTLNNSFREDESESSERAKVVEAVQSANDKKFVFRDQVIKVESAQEVLRHPFKVITMQRMNMVDSVKSSYKVKVNIVPANSKKTTQARKIMVRNCTRRVQYLIKQTVQSNKAQEDSMDPSSKNKDTSDTDYLSHEETFPIVNEIKEKAKVKIKRRTIEWSGQEVLLRYEPYFNVYQTSCLSNVRVWQHGFKGQISKLKYFLKTIARSFILEYIMNALIIINTILISLDRYEQPEKEKDILNRVNNAIAGIVVGEFVFKLIGLGVVKYFSDSMNYLGFVVAMCSLVQLVFASMLINRQDELYSFQSLKASRVLRIALILRKLKSIKSILEVIGRSIDSFVYIGLLLLVFIFIYALFGMQLYGGRFVFAGEIQRQNFDSFYHAFFSLFQVLTFKNWQDILYPAMRARAPVIAVVYTISWIYLGNYVLLNLFLAIMLNEFSTVDEEIAEENEV
jgi:hypothetical protein